MPAHPEAGAVFVPYAKSLLATIAQATALTRAAAQPHRITVGYTAHLVVTPAVLELRKQNSEATVQTAHLGSDVRDALLEHRVAVAVTRLPCSTEQLHITTLYDEPRALLMRDDHRLAGREFVTLEDIASPRPVGRRVPPPARSSSPSRTSWRWSLPGKSSSSSPRPRS